MTDSLGVGHSASLLGLNYDSEFTLLEMIMSRIHFEIAMAIAIVALTGCSGGHGSAYKEIVSSDRKPLSQVCVIPLYQKHDGISYGPDGAGGHEYPGFYLQTPFTVDSGENFTKNLLPSKRMIPPFIAFGTGYYASRFLLIKGGYLPLLISDSDLFNDEPLILTTASPLEAERVIAVLTAKQPEQEKFYSTFHIQDVIYLPKRDPVAEMVHVEFDSNDISLLRSCK